MVSITATLAAAKVVPVPAAPDVAKAALDLVAKATAASMTTVEARTVLAAKAGPVAKAMAARWMRVGARMVPSAAAMTPVGVRMVPPAKAMAAAPTPAVVTRAAAPRGRPIDVDSLDAPWPHFLAGHDASGGNPR
jgi:hypothetical protein